MTTLNQKKAAPVIAPMTVNVADTIPIIPPIVPPIMPPIEAPDNAIAINATVFINIAFAIFAIT